MKYKHIKRLKMNEKGRDFVVGDLHGCYDLLMFKLNQVNFDDTKDRLFSVGDLIDRGPDSKKCAELIYEPWFFATQGNHERMFFTWQLGQPSNYHGAYDFPRNGGGWAVTGNPGELIPLAVDMMGMMPLVIFVGPKDAGFAVTHARMNSGQHDIDKFVWDRSFYDTIGIRAFDAGIKLNDVFQQQVTLDPYDPKRRLTYVGHNTINRGNTILIDNHLMIDTGAYRFVNGAGTISTDSRLTIINHSEYFATLQGT